MLTIEVAMSEGWDEAKQEFVQTDFRTVELEHSLASLSKWESKHEIPFLGEKEKTTEQTIDYIRMMVLTPDLPEKVFEKLCEKYLGQVNVYIQAKMTATWFREEQNKRKNREVITAELIYYWMTAMNIPFECQYWHLNRLLTLVRVINVKNEPKKKTNRRDVAAQQREIARRRREQLGTRG